jgi:hypothetical protein
VQKAVEEDKELQERQLKTLQFLHSIGFDRIPQSETNKIIAHLNSNSEFRNRFGFKKKIDLEN